MSRLELFVACFRDLALNCEVLDCCQLHLYQLVVDAGLCEDQHQVALEVDANENANAADDQADLVFDLQELLI